MGSVSPGSTTPLLLLSSSPSSNSSSSVLLSRGSLAWAGLPYNPLTSTPSGIPSLSVSEDVGSVSSIRASYESFKPSLSLSARCGFVEVIPSTSAVYVAHPPGPTPVTGSHGDVVSVGLPSGPGLKHGTEPHIVFHVGLTYSSRLVNPSPSGSPFGPSKLDGEVALSPFAASQPSGIPSPSVSQPLTSSSINPSPSSSSDRQSASPSPSGSAESTKPSWSSSKPLAQILPTGSSSHRMVFALPSGPVSPQPGLRYWIESSSFQLLTGTVPFHQIPLSSRLGVPGLSHPVGIR